MHFSNYFRIFEKAEEEMYTKLGLSFIEIRKKYNFWLPRVEAFCKYKSPAAFNDVLLVSLTVEEIMDKAVKYGFNVSNSATQQLIAEGYVVAVVADKTLGHAVSIPKEFVEKLKTFQK